MYNQISLDVDKCLCIYSTVVTSNTPCWQWAGCQTKP